MEYHPLGSTGIKISRLSFGAGPISTLMVGDNEEQQRRVVEHAIRSGINWFDTAPTYGSGRSETALGKALAEIKTDGLPDTFSLPGDSFPSKNGSSNPIHIATKARLMPADLGDIRGTILRSFEGSLQRLGVQRVTLLQLHNSITRRRGDEPTSLTPADVLGANGVLETFQQLRDEGLVMHIGLTGIGQPAALREVVHSGEFATMQVPYNILNPSAGREMPDTFADTDYGNIIGDCGQFGMGVLAIRVLAGGALVNSPPSPHTFKTPFFPLSLYEQDRLRAVQLHNQLGPKRNLKSEAIRFALAHPHVNSALIGFGATWQIDEALATLASQEQCLHWEDVPVLE